MVPSDPEPARNFATTHWSLVAAAGHKSSPDSRAALARLCEAYWYPLYAFVRRRGHGADQAQDLIQEFFARLLEKDFITAADPKRGRFRSFLLAALKNFLANEWDKQQAQKRGSGRAPVSWDFEGGESRYRTEPASALTAERIFARQWALAVLDQVLTRLRQEHARAGREDRFEQLKVFLTGERGRISSAAIAEKLGMTAAAVKTAAHRLRRRYRELLREEIAQTVDSSEQLEEETRDLFAALGS